MEGDRPESIRKSAGSSDPVAQSKHAAMIDRLSNLHQSRLQQSAARRSADSAAASPAFESVSSFLSLFSDRKRSVEEDIQRCRALAADPASAPGLKPALDEVAASVADLDRLVAENSYFLPSYEVRSSLKAIDDLKEALERANSELLPRKKFSFRNKGQKKDPSVLIKEVEEVKGEVVEKSTLPAPRQSPGFRNKDGETLMKDFRDSEKGEGQGDFTLADLNSCQVYLKGRFRALFMHRLQNCQVFAGPVLGSILIEEATGCLLMLASHQIRIHQAKMTDFYLRVRSRPIIEDSSSVRVAPYPLSYQGINEDLRESGLAEESGNWGNVDDFKWLRAVQSPNWSIIPEDERLGTKDISDIKDSCNDH